MKNKNGIDIDKVAKTLGVERKPVIKYTGTKLPYQAQAYEKWLAYWQTSVNWSASPDGHDVWDAAIETVADYVLCFDDLTGEEIAAKIRTLKTE